MIKMKSTGIVRCIDDLGRVVIPKEIRKSIGVKEGDQMEIFVTEGGVCFMPHNKPKITNGEILEAFDEMNEADKKALINQLIYRLT